MRLLDNNEALLFIRGERPVKDLKYDILKHPNVKYTMDGNAKPYEHGCVTHDVKDWQNIVLSDKEYELVDEEELENYFKNTPREKILEAWVKSEKYDKIGPKLKTVIRKLKRHEKEKQKSKC